MQNVEFRYFRNPRNFAYRTDEIEPCSVCGKEGIWLYGGGFYGARDIDCICDACLSDGKLKELGIQLGSSLGEEVS